MVAKSQYYVEQVRTYHNMLQLCILYLQLWLCHAASKANLPVDIRTRFVLRVSIDRSCHPTGDNERSTTELLTTQRTPRRGWIKYPYSSKCISNDVCGITIRQHPGRLGPSAPHIVAKSSMRELVRVYRWICPRGNHVSFQTAPPLAGRRAMEKLERGSQEAGRLRLGTISEWSC